MNQPSPQQQAEAKKLVNLSTILMAVGFVTMFAGCGSAAAFKTPVLIGVGMGLGFVVLIVAAIVGQIGRAKQGRVI